MHTYKYNYLLTYLATYLLTHANIHTYAHKDIHPVHTYIGQSIKYFQQSFYIVIDITHHLVSPSIRPSVRPSVHNTRA